MSRCSDCGCTECICNLPSENADRIDYLENRVEELERRVVELEERLKARADPGESMFIKPREGA